MRYSKTRYSTGLAFSSTCSTHRSLTTWLDSDNICSSETSRSAVEGTPSSSICGVRGGQAVSPPGPGARWLGGRPLGARGGPRWAAQALSANETVVLSRLNACPRSRGPGRARGRARQLPGVIQTPRPGPSSARPQGPRRTAAPGVPRGGGQPARGRGRGRGAGPCQAPRTSSRVFFSATRRPVRLHRAL